MPGPVRSRILCWSVLAVVSGAAGSALITSVASASAVSLSGSPGSPSLSVPAKTPSGAGAGEGRSSADSRRGWRSVPAGGRGAASAGLGRVDRTYGARRAAGGFTAVSRAQGLQARFGSDGVSVHSGGSWFGLRVSAVGFGGRLAHRSVGAGRAWQPRDLPPAWTERVVCQRSSAVGAGLHSDGVCRAHTGRSRHRDVRGRRARDRAGQADRSRAAACPSPERRPAEPTVRRRGPPPPRR